MYLTRTPALPALRAQLAQSNRELGTVLLGLEAVRASDPDGWGGADARDAAVRHARRFVFDAALGRIVDALDGYLSRLRRIDVLVTEVPALATHERSVKARLDALAEGLRAELTLELSLAHLAIQWRNRRLHTGSANRLEQQYVAKIRASDDMLAARHGGLTASLLLDHFATSRSPRPRELSALGRATRETCVTLDRALLVAVPPVVLASELLRARFVEVARLREDDDGAADRLESIWTQPAEKRRGRLEQLLRGGGFRNRPIADGQTALDGEWLEALAQSGAREAAARFGLLEERGRERDVGT
jgi:hypothetical protein